MADTKLKDSTLEITITPAIPYTSALVQKLDAMIRGWCPTFGIRHVDFKQTNEPNVYTFKVEHEGGRKWEQKVNFSVDAQDPTVTGTVEDWWKVSEARHHQPMLDVLIQLRNGLGVTRVKVDLA